MALFEPRSPSQTRDKANGRDLWFNTYLDARASAPCKDESRTRVRISSVPQVWQPCVTSDDPTKSEGLTDIMVRRPPQHGQGVTRLGCSDPSNTVPGMLMLPTGEVYSTARRSDESMGFVQCTQRRHRRTERKGPRFSRGPDAAGRARPAQRSAFS